MPYTRRKVLLHTQYVETVQAEFKAEVRHISSGTKPTFPMKGFGLQLCAMQKAIHDNQCNGHASDHVLQPAAVNPINLKTRNRFLIRTRNAVARKM